MGSPQRVQLLSRLPRQISETSGVLFSIGVMDFGFQLHCGENILWPGRTLFFWCTRVTRAEMPKQTPLQTCPVETQVPCHACLQYLIAGKSWLQCAYIIVAGRTSHPPLHSKVLAGRKNHPQHETITPPTFAGLRRRGHAVSLCWHCVRLVLDLGLQLQQVYRWFILLV